MDAKAWQEYENRHRQLRAKYRRRYWVTWLCWFAYYGITAAVVWLICRDRYFNALIYFFILNTAFPLFLAMRHTAKLRRQKEHERCALVESAPLGNLKWE